MFIIQWFWNVVLRVLIKVFDLDFFGQRWVLDYGVVMEKGICTLIQKNDDALAGMIPWSSTMEKWNWIVISTSRGVESLRIPTEVADCIEKGVRLPIEVQTSFITSHRTKIRLAKRKDEIKIPV